MQLKLLKSFLIALRNLQQMHIKLLQKSNLKTADGADDLTGDKIANKITKAASKNVMSKSITSMRTEDVTPKEMDIPAEKRQQINDELKLIQYIDRIEYQNSKLLLLSTTFFITTTYVSKFKTRKWVEK